ncbi:MAG: hydantoinase/oxoprolinase family protein, partial [Acetobacteraceae bacterium]
AAGVGSTIGMLMAPARIDRVAAFSARLATVDWRALERLFQRLEAEAEAVLQATGADPAHARAERLADMRYVGQGSEITVRWPDRPDEDTVRQAFEARYRVLYARTPPGAVISLVALRILLAAPMPGAGSFMAARAADGREAAKGKRAVWFGEAGRMLETPVFDRYALAPGTEIEGPAVLEENESTLIIGPGGRAFVLADGAIDVALPAAADA